jgi:hypothetical protein
MARLLDASRQILTRVIQLFRGAPPSGEPHEKSAPEQPKAKRKKSGREKPAGSKKDKG